MVAFGLGVSVLAAGPAPNRLYSDRGRLCAQTEKKNLKKRGYSSRAAQGVLAELVVARQLDTRLDPELRLAVRRLDVNVQSLLLARRGRRRRIETGHREKPSGSCRHDDLRPRGRRRSEEDVVQVVPLGRAGRRRSPATTSSFHQGVPPRNKGLRYPPDPPTVDETIAVMRAAGNSPEGIRLRGVIVIQRQLGHADLAITSRYLRVIDTPGSSRPRTSAPSRRSLPAESSPPAADASESPDPLGRETATLAASRRPAPAQASPARRSFVADAIASSALRGEQSVRRPALRSHGFLRSFS